jgi:hypothetical protein
MYRRISSIFLLLVCFVVPSVSRAVDMINSSSCATTSRKKNTTKWMPARPFEEQTPVKVLGNSRSMGRPAYILDLLTSPSSDLEYKVAASCVTSNESEIAATPADNKSKQKKNALAQQVVLAQLPRGNDPVDNSFFELDLFLAKHSEYFQDKGKTTSDAVSSTFYGLEVRKMNQLQLNTWSFEVGYGLNASYIKGNTGNPGANNVELTALGFGLSGYGRVVYRSSDSFGVGLALPVQILKVLWPSSDEGAMQDSLSIRTSILLFSDFVVGKNSNISIAGGLTEDLESLEIRTGFSF